MIAPLLLALWQSAAMGVWSPELEPALWRQQCDRLGLRLEQQQDHDLAAELHSRVALSQWLIQAHPSALWRDAGAYCELNLTLSWRENEPSQGPWAGEPAAAAEALSEDLAEATNAYLYQLGEANQRYPELPANCPTINELSLDSYWRQASFSCQQALYHGWLSRGGAASMGAYQQLRLARHAFALATGENSWRQRRHRHSLLTPAEADLFMLAASRANHACGALTGPPWQTVPQPAHEDPPSLALSRLLTTMERDFALQLSARPSPFWHPQILVFQVGADGPWLVLDLLARPQKTTRRPRMMPLQWNAAGKVQALLLVAALPQQSWSGEEQLAIAELLGQAAAALQWPNREIPADMTRLTGEIARQWYARELGMGSSLAAVGQLDVAVGEQ